MSRILYQGLVQPPFGGPETVTESRWHQAWSTPVRIKPGVGAYLQQFRTGDTSPFPVSNYESWYQWFSEPVRFKNGLGPHLQRFEISLIPQQFVVSQSNPWFNWLSEPVRFKPRVLAADQPFFFFEPEPPEFLDIPWYANLAEPVRLPKGLRAQLQQFLAYHPRILPTPTVFVTMAATETNNDVFLGGVIVYSSVSPATSGQGAVVSVVEVPESGGTAPISIQED